MQQPSSSSLETNAPAKRRAVSWALLLAASAGAVLPLSATVPALAGEESGEHEHGTLAVARLVVARGVEGREPVDAGASFSSAELERVYAFVELSNEARVASAITVSFVPPGNGPPRRVVLRVGERRRFRTWAYTKNPHVLGTWTVIVTEVGGLELGRASFEVTP